MLLLVEGLMNGKGFLGNDDGWWMQCTDFSSQNWITHFPSPMSLLPPPPEWCDDTAMGALLSKGGLEGSYSYCCTACWRLMLGLSNISLRQVHAVHCRVLPWKAKCDQHLEYSDFSLGCLPPPMPLAECLCLEYWASLTPSFQPVWSLSPSTRIAQLGTKIVDQTYPHFSGLSWLKSKFLHAAGAGYWDEMCSQWNHFVETLECNQLSQVAHLIGNLASLGVE